jgi:hypothetical protein
MPSPISVFICVSVSVGSHVDGSFGLFCRRQDSHPQRTSVGAGLKRKKRYSTNDYHCERTVFVSRNDHDEYFLYRIMTYSYALLVYYFYCPVQEKLLNRGQAQVSKALGLAAERRTTCKSVGNSEGRTRIFSLGVNCFGSDPGMSRSVPSCVVCQVYANCCSRNCCSMRKGVLSALHSGRTSGPSPSIWTK